MSQFLGFGNFQDGDVEFTVSATETVIDSPAATDADTVRLDATNGSFAANQLILIHQTQGPLNGGWEVNQINSYAAGFITPSIPLVNTYSITGGNSHQVRVIPQYRNVIIDVGVVITCKGWNGATGGLMTWCGSSLTNNGTLSGVGCGFRGGGTGVDDNGFSGEGCIHTSQKNVADTGDNGGGCHHVSSCGGTNAQDIAFNLGDSGGVFSHAVGLADLSVGDLGGGGAGAASGGSVSSGANGGAYGIFAFVTCTNSATGLIDFSGGAAASVGSPGRAGAGGGGGSLLFNFITMSNLGTIQAIYGPPGGGGNDTHASYGGLGRVRIQGCSFSGNDSNPASSQQIGGVSWCSVPSAML